MIEIAQDRQKRGPDGLLHANQTRRIARTQPTTCRRVRSRFDDELQPDLELTEGPATSGRMAAYAVAALLIVGAVLYGVTHTSTSDTASTTSSPATNTAANAPSPAPAATGAQRHTGRLNTQAGDDQARRSADGLQLPSLALQSTPGSGRPVEITADSAITRPHHDHHAR